MQKSISISDFSLIVKEFKKKKDKSLGQEVAEE